MCFICLDNPKFSVIIIKLIEHKRGKNGRLSSNENESGTLWEKKQHSTAIPPHTLRCSKKKSMFSFSWTNIILVLFFAYLANSVYVLYVLFNPNECNIKKEGNKKCIEPSYKLEDLPTLKVKISFVTSPFLT